MDRASSMHEIHGEYVQNLVVKFGGNNLLEGNEHRCGCNINPLNAKFNPLYNMLALLGTHHLLHVSRIWVNICIKKCIILDFTGSLSVSVSDSFEHSNTSCVELLH
jgi:hypothetical protein